MSKKDIKIEIINDECFEDFKSSGPCCAESVPVDKEPEACSIDSKDKKT